MPFLGNTTTSFNVDGNNINNGAITSEKIAAGAVVNADVNDSASIAGTKISADFGAQDLIVDTNLLFVDASADHIGIGTSSPAASLHVKNATEGDAYFKANSGDGVTDRGLVIKSGTGAFTGSKHIFDAISSGGQLEFRTAGTPALLIDQSQRVGIGTTSPSVKCSIGGVSGTALQLKTADTNFSALNIGIASDHSFINSASSGSGTTHPLAFDVGGSEAARIDTSGRLLVGTPSGTDNLRFDQKLAVVSTGASNLGGAAFISYAGTSTDVGSFIDLSRSRGTTDGSFTAVANGDTLGWLIFRGSDGSGFVNSAYIKGSVDGTPGTNDVPGRLGFFTADAGVAPSERLRINANGMVELRANQGTAQTNIIRFTDTDTSVAGDQVLGQLQWFSSDNSGGGACVKAEIAAVCDDTTPDVRLEIKTHSGSSTDPIESVRITSAGNIQLRRTGTGIDFAASQGAPDAGTSTSEVLDGYEEGTWTPAIASGGWTLNATYFANYVKIGRQVTVQCYIALSGTGNSNGFQISGLPFNPASNGYSTGIADFNKPGKSGIIVRAAPGSDTVSYLYSNNSASTQRSELNGGQIGDGYHIFTLTYQV